MQPSITTSSATPSPKPQKHVPAVVLRLILEGIREVAGSQFPRVLAEANLTQYSELPPPDQSPTVTEHELSALYGATFRVVGESLTRLFLTRYGQKLPDTMIAGPSGQEAMAKMQSVPDNERIGVAMHLIAETGTKLWTPMAVTEDDEAFYLEIEHCAICANIRGAKSPICANSEFFYGAFARALTGFRLTALEVECAAMGAPRCKYRVRK